MFILMEDEIWRKHFDKAKETVPWLKTVDQV